MKEKRSLFLSKHLVQIGGVVFAHVLGHILYAATENAFAEVNLDYVAQLQIVCGLYDLTVDQNVAFTAGVVGDAAAFDDTGYL